MIKIEKNNIYRVHIDGYSSDGAGVARIESFVVFVRGGIRGEVCDIKILKVGKKVAFGKIEKIIEPSGRRVEPVCPYFVKCGGCDFWHMSYVEELEAKQIRVEDALRRIGGQNMSVSVIIGANNTECYRNKALYPVAMDAKGKAITGFYRARSHDVVPVDRCLIQSPIADAAAAAVRRWMDEYTVPAYDEQTGKGLIRHVYVRTAGGTGEALICIVAAAESLPQAGRLVALLRKACPQAVGVVLSANLSPGNVVLGDRYSVLWGEGSIEDTLLGLTFRISPHSFYQINREQAERLYNKVIEFAGLDGSQTVLDLYCGTGTITLAMARYAKRVIGAEIVSAAIADAKVNAARNGIQNAEFFCGDAGEMAKRFKTEGVSPDVIVVDPPRKGLDATVIGEMLDMSPKRLVYVSCDPATMARDVKLLCAGQYRLVQVCAVDMFPHTAHVETIILMTRSGSGEKK